MKEGKIRWFNYEYLISVFDLPRLYVLFELISLVSRYKILNTKKIQNRRPQKLA